MCYTGLYRMLLFYPKTLWRNYFISAKLPSPCYSAASLDYSVNAGESQPVHAPTDSLLLALPSSPSSRLTPLVSAKPRAWRPRLLWASDSLVPALLFTAKTTLKVLPLPPASGWWLQLAWPSAFGILFLPPAQQYSCSSSSLSTTIAFKKQILNLKHHHFLHYPNYPKNKKTVLSRAVFV